MKNPLTPQKHRCCQFIRIFVSRSLKRVLHPEAWLTQMQGSYNPLPAAAGIAVCPTLAHVELSFDQLCFIISSTLEPYFYSFVAGILILLHFFCQLHNVNLEFNFILFLRTVLNIRSILIEYFTCASLLGQKGSTLKIELRFRKCFKINFIFHQLQHSQVTPNDLLF